MASSLSIAALATEGSASMISSMCVPKLGVWSWYQIDKYLNVLTTCFMAKGNLARDNILEISSMGGHLSLFWGDLKRASAAALLLVLKAVDFAIMVPLCQGGETVKFWTLRCNPPCLTPHRVSLGIHAIVSINSYMSKVFQSLPGATWANEFHSSTKISLALLLEIVFN